MPEEMQEAAVEVDPAVGAPEPTVETPEAAEVVEAGIPEVFTVKVGGEEVQVTLDEALKGYQRQSDYTQKTQQLAQQREQLSHAERLWESIEAAPEATLKKIAAAYGLDWGTSPTQQQTQADPFEEAFEETSNTADPRLSAIEKFMQEAQEREIQASIDAEIASVRTKYGQPDLDGQQLIEYAVEHNIGDLDAAFRAMSFDAVRQQAARGRKVVAKATAPPIAGGHSVQEGVLVPGAGSKFPTIEESFAIAESMQQSS